MTMACTATKLDRRLLRSCSPRHVSRARRGLVQGVTRAARLLGLTPLLLAARPGRYIFAYHRILTPDEARGEWCHPSIWITPQTFEAQIAHLKKIGRVVPLRTLLEDTTTPGNTFAITFDDAWSDNYRYALPVLERHRIQACFFVPTGAVSTGDLFWTERLALQLGHAASSGSAGALIEALCVPGEAEIAASHAGMLALILDCIERIKLFSDADRDAAIAELVDLLGLGAGSTSGRVMTWDQIRELHRLGHEIGSHTRTHRILQGVETATVDRELRESKDEIEREIGASVRYFCYPNARYDQVSAARVTACGYERGFRMHNLRVGDATNPSTVPRFSVAEVNGRVPLLDWRLAMSGTG
jgi:peptidoglycan/xylan/chitin deacetylase (PgdA/CDA1 family)